MPSTILRGTDFDVSKVHFSPSKSNSSGRGRHVPINYGDPAIQPVLQTPKMFLPFGVDRYQPDDGSSPKYSLTLSFKGMQENEKLKHFYETLKQLDQKLLQHAVDHQSDWWPGVTGKSIDVMEMVCSGFVRKNKNSSYADFAKVKIDHRDNRCLASFFDHQQNVMDLSSVQPKSTVLALVELGPVWLTGSTATASLKLVQAQIFPPAGITGFAIVHEEDDPVFPIDDDY
jgi:hypothetical protein